MGFSFESKSYCTRSIPKDSSEVGDNFSEEPLAFRCVRDQRERRPTQSRGKASFPRIGATNTASPLDVMHGANRLIKIYGSTPWAFLRQRL